MDISKITDIKELKAMAYDALAQVELAQQNLRVLNERIAAVSNEQSDEKTEKPAKNTTDAHE